MSEQPTDRDHWMGLVGDEGAVDCCKREPCQMISLLPIRIDAEGDAMPRVLRLGLCC